MERSRKKQRVLIGLAFAVGMGVASAPVEAKITANQTPEYIQECESEGVPIPDVVDINGGNGWVKKGALSPDRVAQTGSFGPAEVHYWVHSDESVCIALPREVQGDRSKFSAIGVICQRKSSGEACFLDTNGEKTRATGVYNIRRPGLRDFVGGEGFDRQMYLVSSCHGPGRAFGEFPELSRATASACDHPVVDGR